MKLTDVLEPEDTIHVPERFFYRMTSDHRPAARPGRAPVPRRPAQAAGSAPDRRRPQPAGGRALQLHDAARVPGHRPDPHRQGPAQGPARQPDGGPRPAGHADRIRAAARPRARRAPGQAAGAADEPRAADGPDDGPLGAFPAQVPGPRPRGDGGRGRHAALAGGGRGALPDLRGAAARRPPGEPALPRLRPRDRRPTPPTRWPSSTSSSAASCGSRPRARPRTGSADRVQAQKARSSRTPSARSSPTRRSNGIAAGDAGTRRREQRPPSPPRR